MQQHFSESLIYRIKRVNFLIFEKLVLILYEKRFNMLIKVDCRLFAIIKNN
jgi:hypothetical protein